MQTHTYIHRPQSVLNIQINKKIKLVCVFSNIEVNFVFCLIFFYISCIPVDVVGTCFSWAGQLWPNDMILNSEACDEDLSQ